MDPEVSPLGPAQVAAPSHGQTSKPAGAVPESDRDLQDLVAKSSRPAPWHRSHFDSSQEEAVSGSQEPPAQREQHEEFEGVDDYMLEEALVEAPVNLWSMPEEIGDCLQEVVNEQPKPKQAVKPSASSSAKNMAERVKKALPEQVVNTKATVGKTVPLPQCG